MPARKLPPNDEVVAAYRAGRSSGELARQWGVSPDAVLGCLRRAGEPRRSNAAASALREAHGYPRSRPWLGRTQTPEHVEQRAAATRGPKHHLWRGGYERRPYRNLIEKVECADCGSTEKLCIHHVNLDFYNNSPENLVALCQHCHLSLHARLRWQAYREGRPCPKSTGPCHWKKAAEVAPPISLDDYRRRREQAAADDEVAA